MHGMGAISDEDKLDAEALELRALVRGCVAELETVGPESQRLGRHVVAVESDRDVPRQLHRAVELDHVPAELRFRRW